MTEPERNRPEAPIFPRRGSVSGHPGPMTRRTVAVTTAVLLALAPALTACGGNGEKAESKAPPYKVISRDKTGKWRYVYVEVRSDRKLRAVFDDVVERVPGGAGYFVIITCSTGSAGKKENTLAKGEYAAGKVGAESTGLKPGASEFKRARGAECPAGGDTDAALRARRG